jgi:hypothetical protein
VSLLTVPFWSPSGKNRIVSESAEFSADSLGDILVGCSILTRFANILPCCLCI